jgi:hypothetical protein
MDDLWQPIETAPRNGTRFIGAQKTDEGWRITVCFSNVWQGEQFWQFGGLKEHPDYWLPLNALPSPPKNTGDRT